MVWLNGSVLHDPPTKTYECRVCHLSVTKQPSGEYDVKQTDSEGQSIAQS
jgi:hypothetical protein